MARFKCGRAAGGDPHGVEAALGRGVEVGPYIVGEIRHLPEPGLGKAAGWVRGVQPRDLAHHLTGQRRRDLDPERVEADVVGERFALQGYPHLQEATSAPAGRAGRIG